MLHIHQGISYLFIYTKPIPPNIQDGIQACMKSSRIKEMKMKIRQRRETIQQNKTGSRKR
jgi:hypothetical protein